MVENGVRPIDYYIDPSPVRNPFSEHNGKAEIYPLGIDEDPEYVNIFGKDVIERIEHSEGIEETVLFYVSETSFGIPNPSGYRDSEYMVKATCVSDSKGRESLCKIDFGSPIVELELNQETSILLAAD
ncbi:MAG TPA: hypothetical protein PLD54_02260 [Candidatus Levybacteria bacterium]|nr:hypothetical protein [Candidatus Levybacteria bacterium]